MLLRAPGFNRMYWSRQQAAIISFDFARIHQHRPKPRTVKKHMHKSPRPVPSISPSVPTTATTTTPIRAQPPTGPQALRVPHRIKGAPIRNPQNRIPLAVATGTTGGERDADPAGVPAHRGVVGLFLLLCVHGGWCM